ncbi:MAG: NAD-dependent epimerase/dehydratase family protein [Bradymonadia bacterium]
MKTALVTGGGGFLGGAIVRQLRTEGVRIRSLSRSKYDWLDDFGVESFIGDLANRDDVMRAVDGVDIVYHVAAKAGVWGARQAYEDVNVLGTSNVLHACQTFAVRHLVYTSTPSVVHAGADIAGADESLPYPTHFETHYPETKARAEQMVLDANSEDLRTVALRPHLIWGPGDNHLLPRIIDRARRGRLRLVGPPFPLVDSTYIVDAARAHLLAARELAGAGRCAGRAYFISQGEPWPTDKLINGLLEASGEASCERLVGPRTALLIGAFLEFIYRFFRIQHEPPMTRFVAKQLSTAHWYNIDAAKRDFGYEPTYSIDTALGELQDHRPGA